jgi:hypothetical protein
MLLHLIFKKCERQESNLQPLVSRTNALPLSYSRLLYISILVPPFSQTIQRLLYGKNHIHPKCQSIYIK